MSGAAAKVERVRGGSTRNRPSGRETAPVGETYASLTLLTDAIGSIQSFVSVFVTVYILLIFAYVLTSWIRVPHSLQPLVRFLHDVCEPYLRLFRRILPPLGPIDVSPIVGVVVLVAVDQIAVRLLGRLD